MAGRLPVAKTYKLFIDGAFPRSESGRTFPVHGPSGTLLANAAQASRKDLRDAVRTARAAQEGWAARTAYNRGQVLYRVAEMLEGRRTELATLLSYTGLGTEAAEEEVEATIDRWVWYAGWSDKVHHVLGTVNPVAGPYFNFTVPEPTGVVGLVGLHGDQIHGNGRTGEQAQVAGWAAIAQQHQPPGAGQLTRPLR